jgi:glycosyltransferase involved in cell wall biosynthesis
MRSDPGRAALRTVEDPWLVFSGRSPYTPRVPPLSVTIITLNEAARLGAAVASVAWADEVVVVDAGSTDGTVDLARRLAARVEVREWAGFAAQKNYAASLARHDWILSLDADERVSSALAAALQGWRSGTPAAQGYRIARTSSYLGEWIRTTDWYPDYQLRLYDRRAGTWQPARVHESVRVMGSAGSLSGEIEHYPYADVSDHLQRIDRYTTLAALDMRDRGRTASPLHLLLHPPAAFLRNYVLRRGALQGRVGLTVSLLNSYYVLLKYVKLFELEIGARRDQSRGSVS